MARFKNSRGVLLIALALLGGAAPASAHHSYAQFDRERAVTIEGVLERIEWSNPHVVMQIRADDGALYRIEWQAMSRLSRAGVDRNPFTVGDRLVLTGAAHRDPAVHVMTLMLDISRPADGWSWRDARDFRRAELWPEDTSRRPGP